MRKPDAQTDEPDRQGSRQRILQAALAVFAEYGFAGATTREIASRAHVHQPAIAYHFGNKTKLWKAASSHLAAEQLAFLKYHATRTAEAEDPIAAFVGHYMAFAARHPHWAMFVVKAASQRAELGHWLAQTCLKPVAEQLFQTLAGEPWPDGDDAHARRAVSLVSLLTGASVIFAEHTLVSAFSTIDTRSEAFVREHASLVTTAIKALLAARKNAGRTGRHQKAD